MNENKEQAIIDRKQEVEGSIMGIYMHNNHMKELPINKKTMDEIVDFLAPCFISMTQYEANQLSQIIKKDLNKLTDEEKETVKLLIQKVLLFAH